MNAFPGKPKNQPLDHNLYSRPGVYTFFTIRTWMTTRPFTTPKLARMVVNILLACQQDLACTITAYCLMPDHIHYLITPQEEGCSVMDFTRLFKGRSTHLSWNSGWQGRLWQPRFYDHVLRHDEDWKQVAEYIIMNPVHEGFVKEWGDWKWSALVVD